MKKLLLLLFSAIIISGCSIDSANDTPVSENQLKQIVQTKMNEYGVPGMQVCIKYKNGRFVNFALGSSNLTNHSAMTSNTQIKIGSMTKSFTAMGILILVQRKLVNLDDEIGKYVNIEEEKFKHITLKQLMNMHSGLRGYINDDDADYIVDEAIANPSRRFKPEELINHGFKITDEQGMTADSIFHYTNTNYILLGMVIEKVSHKTYSDFIRSEIIEPLGLQSTFIPTDNNYGQNVSRGYHLDKTDSSTTDYSDLDLSYVWSAGDIISTAKDISNWISLIGNDKVVSGIAHQYVYNGFIIQGEDQYTAGLLNQRDMLWHNGTVLGYHGEMRYLKATGTAVAVLSNCTIAGAEGDPVKEVIDEITELVSK